MSGVCERQCHIYGCAEPTVVGGCRACTGLQTTKSTFMRLKGQDKGPK